MLAVDPLLSHPAGAIQDALRLKENGVFCVYANGTPQQALAVRQTASGVFPNILALHNGYILILSHSPLDSSPGRLETVIAQVGSLWKEVRFFREKIGIKKWLEYIEPSSLVMADSRITIRDDFPIVEYPWYLQRLVEAMALKEPLPQPNFNWVQ